MDKCLDHLKQYWDEEVLAFCSHSTEVTPTKHRFGMNFTELKDIARFCVTVPCLCNVAFTVLLKKYFPQSCNTKCVHSNVQNFDILETRALTLLIRRSLRMIFLYQLKGNIKCSIPFRCRH
jgi:hypothetical protein